MKLASLRTNSRDGLLLVVSRDLGRAVAASTVVPSLQQALEHWPKVAPRLDLLYQSLNAGRAADSFPFDPLRCAAPLSRAYQWLHGATYAGHVALLEASAPGSTNTLLASPRLGQGRSDAMMGPRDGVLLASEEQGVDFAAELVALTGDLPMLTERDAAERGIRLYGLACTVFRRALLAGDLAAGLGLFQSRHAAALAPVVITPDEWEASTGSPRPARMIELLLNGQRFGAVDAHRDAAHGISELVFHACEQQAIVAGTLVSTGPILNLDAALGPGCIAEKRQREFEQQGRSVTPFLRFGDRFGVRMRAPGGESLFGSVELELRRYRPT